MPPRVASAEKLTDPAAIAAAIAEFVAAHPNAAVLEGGKTLFELRSSGHTVSTDHERCTLHVWSGERNLARMVVSASVKPKRLRLDTARLGVKGTRAVDLVASVERRARTARDTARAAHMATVERVLAREFPGWKPESFRTAMDLERSFGPAYARGVLAQGKDAWAVIAVNAGESAAMVDGVLTLGILWLHHCRERSDGRRLFRGLKVIVPRGMGALTQTRMAWLRADAAQWELWELDEASEELRARDLDDTGNVRTALVHRPDEAAARERFAKAIARVMELLPPGEAARVDQHLRSTSELAFLLHGLEFARARISLAPNSFAHTLEITVGVGPQETALSDANRREMAKLVSELFARRKAVEPLPRRVSRQIGIGAKDLVAHARVNLGRVNQALNPAQDPLYRAAPERWLESVLQRDLTTLTRGLAAAPPKRFGRRARVADANDDDNFGNRAEPAENNLWAGSADRRVIPRLDPQAVYAQVPAIAGASDRGMIDLLGVSADGRLAVIELKASEDLHFALQGLDYWLRVRHHAAPDAGGVADFQRFGYFTASQLSPLPPRLYLVAPALRIHPATETVLKYLSPKVEWQLLALDERWREQVRVVWRRSGGNAV